MRCSECAGHLYGCPYEDEDITDCDEGQALTRMAGLAYECGRKEALEQLFEAIPIEKSESMYDNGEEGDLCFQLTDDGHYEDGIYFGLRGDGWDRNGEPLVPEWCNYCIRLPWKAINDAISRKCEELQKKEEEARNGHGL